MEDSPYLRIVETIDQSPLRAPKAGGSFSKAFIAYLKLIYSPEEANLVQHLRMPAKFTTVEQVAAASGKDGGEVQKVFDDLARRSGILKMGDMCSLPTIPTLLNIHQFYPEKKPEDLEAIRLYKEFFIKEGYYKYYESSEKGTPVMRVIPVERTIEHGQQVLKGEEALRLIDDLPGDQLALVPCPCRTRTEKLGERECKEKNPVGACIMIGLPAMHFQSIGLGKKVSREQAKGYLLEMQDLGLVATTENYKDPNHLIICLCCECCCSQTRGRTRWDNPNALAPSNFLPQANEECVLCGTCVDRCFFGAISLDEKAGRAVANPEKCLGCGLCTITCPQEALKLQRVDSSLIYETAKELFKKIALENRGAA